MGKELGVEIGPCNFSFISLLRRDLAGSGTVVCFDRQESSIRRSKDFSREEMLWVVGDAREMPLKTGSVSIVLAKDIFGSGRKYLFPSENLYKQEEIDFQDMELAKEFFRICQKGGRVVVMETINPASPQKLTEKFIAAGFEINEGYTWKDIIKVFQPENTSFERIYLPQDFALVFCKD